MKFPVAALTACLITFALSACDGDSGDKVYVNAYEPSNLQTDLIVNNTEQSRGISQY